MYSINFSKTGGPEVLKYEKLSISEPKESEVLIKHSAIGLNFIDTYHRSGLYLSLIHISEPTRRM